MIATKTTAMVVALAGAAILGALATVGNQAAFAQVTQTPTNTNTQTATLNCSPSAGGFLSSASSTCSVNQEQGNCQMNVGADEESEASGEFESEDCS
jgi:hypothetical protein